jgi:hypothetical protein
MKLTLLKYILYFTFIFFLGDVVGQERFFPTDYDSDYSGGRLSLGGIIGVVLVGILSLIATGIFALVCALIYGLITRWIPEIYSFLRRYWGIIAGIGFMIVVFGGEDKKPIKNDVDSEVIVPVTNETAEVKTGTSHDFKKLIAEPKLDAWVEANPWFHSEKEMRVFALEIHEKLVSEGADTDSDKYYSQIDDAMKNAYPEYFGFSESNGANEDKIEAPAKVAASDDLDKLIAKLMARRKIELVSIEHELNKSRIIFKISGAIKNTHKIFLMENPYRLVIDINDIQTGEGFNRDNLTGHLLNDTPILNVRGRHDEDRLRIVLDLKNKVIFRSSLIKGNTPDHHRLIVDLY